MKGSSFTWRAVAAVAIATICMAPRAHAQAKSAAPDTSVITDRLVAEGRDVFRGHGGCVVCHGQNLEGLVGPTLKAHKWKDAENGDFASLIHVVSSGVPGTVMVARPNGVSDAQIIAVAAYVWSVNHRKTKP